MVACSAWGLTRRAVDDVIDIDDDADNDDDVNDVGTVVAVDPVCFTPFPCSSASLFCLSKLDGNRRLPASARVANIVVNLKTFKLDC